MTFTSPPTAPSRSMTSAEFVSAADLYVAWQINFRNDLESVWASILAAIAAPASVEGLATAFSTSTTPNTIVDTGNVTFTVSAGKGFLPGMYVRAARTSAPATTSMSGTVFSYSGTSLVVTMDNKVGSGSSITDWTISPAAKNGLPAASVANLWAAVSNALSLTPQALGLATAYQAISDATTIATNLANGVHFKCTLGGSRTVGAPTGTPIDGWVYAWAWTQDGTGNRKLSWNAVFDWGDMGAPDLSAGAGKTDFCYGQYFAATGKYIMSFRRSA